MERTHPENRPFVQQIVDAACRQCQDLDFEHRLLMPGGSVKNLRVVGHPVTRGSSGDWEYVGAVTDITERKRAQAELQQLVDFVPQLIVVLGPDGELIQVNRVARDYASPAQERSLWDRAV